MAESEGFEPPVNMHPYPFLRRLPSATQAALRLLEYTRTAPRWFIAVSLNFKASKAPAAQVPALLHQTGNLIFAIDPALAYPNEHEKRAARQPAEQALEAAI